MSFEQMGGFNEQVLLGNQMQMMLAEHHGEALDEFIDKHAAEFRTYVTLHPEVITLFKENPDKACQEVEQVLYPQETQMH